MTVYIIMKEMDYASEDIVSVHSTEALAKTELDAIVSKNFDMWHKERAKNYDIEHTRTVKQCIRNEYTIYDWKVDDDE